MDERWYKWISESGEVVSDTPNHKFLVTPKPI